MKKKQKILNIYLFFLILLLFPTSFLSIKTFKKLSIKDIKIHGTNVFTINDLVKNSSLNLSTRLIFIKTKYIEEELRRNLSLKNVSVNRQIFPFGLKILIKTRAPVALGEKDLDGKKISGYIDENGFFIDKEFTEKINLENLTVQVYGWRDNYKKTLSKILTFQKNGEIELLEIKFSSNSFLTLEEKDLKTLLLGFNPDLISSQLKVISQLKDQLNKYKFSEKIDIIDLTDPENPIIKVFKP